MAEDQTPDTVEPTAADEAVAPTAEASAAANAPAAPSAPSAPLEVVAPKERRRRARAARAARVGTRPARTPEERQAQRQADRAQKARARRTERAKARTKAAAAPSGETTPPREHVAGTQKVRQGVVVSDKADKTITVRIDVARRHRRYDKIVRTSQTFHAHDERNDAHIGDTVTIREARPLSRLKRWRLIEVLERAK
jgi:small subunit ribosomal protein S17